MAPERPVVAKRNSGRRGRARKRRPSSSSTQDAIAAPQRAARAPARAHDARRAPAAASARARASARPQAPWHPWPLSELLILVGAIGAVVAWRAGIEGHLLLLGASVVAVGIGTIEVTLREHMSGYRSHTALLASIPPIVFHSAVILALVAFIRVPRWVNFPLLAIDAVLFVALFRLLRARYLDARRERVFAGASR